jgi:hypothetical protein
MSGSAPALQRLRRVLRRPVHGPPGLAYLLPSLNVQVQRLGRRVPIDLLPIEHGKRVGQPCHLGIVLRLAALHEHRVTLTESGSAGLQAPIVDAALPALRFEMLAGERGAPAEPDQPQSEQRPDHDEPIRPDLRRGAEHRSPFRSTFSFLAAH